MKMALGVWKHQHYKIGQGFHTTWGKERRKKSKTCGLGPKCNYGHYVNLNYENLNIGVVNKRGWNTILGG